VSGVEFEVSFCRYKWYVKISPTKFNPTVALTKYIPYNVLV